MDITNIKDYMQTVGQNARAASRLMAKADTASKNRALHDGRCDQARRKNLLTANTRDLESAKFSAGCGRHDRSLGAC